jgi:hypothetical protein
MVHLCALPHSSRGSTILDLREPDLDLPPILDLREPSLDLPPGVAAARRWPAPPSLAGAAVAGIGPQALRGSRQGRAEGFDAGNSRAHAPRAGSSGLSRGDDGVQHALTHLLRLGEQDDNEATRRHGRQSTRVPAFFQYIRRGRRGRVRAHLSVRADGSASRTAVRRNHLPWDQ